MSSQLEKEIPTGNDECNTAPESMQCFKTVKCGKESYKKPCSRESSND